MVEKMYKWASRLLQTRWFFSCTDTETIGTSNLMELNWSWENTIRFW